MQTLLRLELKLSQTINMVSFDSLILRIKSSRIFNKSCSSSIKFHVKENSQNRVWSGSAVVLDFLGDFCKAFCNVNVHVHVIFIQKNHTSQLVWPYFITFWIHFSSFIPEIKNWLELKRQKSQKTFEDVLNHCDWDVIV